MIHIRSKENCSGGCWRVAPTIIPYFLKSLRKSNYCKPLKSLSHMNPSIQKIQALLPSLPQKDAKIADKLLSERKFEDLLEIIDSDIYLVRRDQLKETPKEEYVNISLESLLQLRSELSEYMSYLVLPEDDLDDLGCQYFEDYE